MVDYLVGSAWARELFDAEPRIHAPHVLDVEVLGVLRRLVRLGDLSARRAGVALEDLASLRIRRYPHVPLLPAMWKLRDNMGARDAAFVTLAVALDADLVTRDQRLARAVRKRVRVVSP